MRVLIDSLAVQARIHRKDGKRLADFLQCLQRIPDCAVAFSTPAPLSEESLFHYDVLVVTTRKKQDADYTEAELITIHDFVQQGGGLLLMSNHSDIPGRPYPDMTASDARLAHQFGIELENSFFASPEWNKVVEVPTIPEQADHPVLRGVGGDNPVRSVVTNNCCSIKEGAASPIIALPETMQDYRQGRSCHGRYFAVACDRDPGGRAGRMVVVADSGFIGSGETTYPGIGLMGMGDNRKFITNSMLWIGKDDHDTKGSSNRRL